MTDIMAAFGLAQYDRYPSLLQRRREIIKRYDCAFSSLNVQTLSHYSETSASSGHLYIVRLLNHDSEYRNQVIIRMAEEGIACNVHYKPLPLLTAYKNLGFDIDDYPNAYAMYHNAMTLPLHTRLSDEDVDYIIERFTDILQNG